jgi:hypothetical protein
LQGSSPGGILTITDWRRLRDGGGLRQSVDIDIKLGKSSPRRRRLRRCEACVRFRLPGDEIDAEGDRHDADEVGRRRTLAEYQPSER